MKEDLLIGDPFLRHITSIFCPQFTQIIFPSFNIILLDYRSTLCAFGYGVRTRNG